MSQNKLQMKKNRSAYDIAKMMLIKMHRVNLLNTLDFIEYAERIQPSFKNEIVKTQVFMHIKDLFDDRGFQLQLV